MRKHITESDKNFLEEKYRHYMAKRLTNCNAAIEERNKKLRMGTARTNQSPSPFTSSIADNTGERSHSNPRFKDISSDDDKNKVLDDMKKHKESQITKIMMLKLGQEKHKREKIRKIENKLELVTKKYNEERKAKVNAMANHINMVTEVKKKYEQSVQQNFIYQEEKLSSLKRKFEKM